jgi:hypothetical protein
MMSRGILILAGIISLLLLFLFEKDEADHPQSLVYMSDIHNAHLPATLQVVSFGREALPTVGDDVQLRPPCPLEIDKETSE